jgi:threonine dehydrogenase-like Zn-dependent dehydrogenase
MNGDGGQGEAVRVPLADSTLVSVPGSGHSDEMMRSLLSLSDVFATGHHAAVCARVNAGQTVAVVGDGAVGLSAVLAAKRLGAERIIAMSRHADRQQLATQFGATDIVAERGDEAIEKVKGLTDGVGVDATMECGGTGQASRERSGAYAARLLFLASMAPFWFFTTQWLQSVHGYSPDSPLGRVLTAETFPASFEPIAE